MAKTWKVIAFDLGAVERRLLAQVTPERPLNKFYSMAVKLPKKHPLRFALLYGAGTRKVED